jgi:hypothetical protein
MKQSSKNLNRSAANLGFVEGYSRLHVPCLPERCAFRIYDAPYGASDPSGTCGAATRSETPTTLARFRTPSEFD